MPLLFVGPRSNPFNLGLRRSPDLVNTFTINVPTLKVIDLWDFDVIDPFWHSNSIVN